MDMCCSKCYQCPSITLCAYNLVSQCQHWQLSACDLFWARKHARSHMRLAGSSKQLTPLGVVLNQWWGQLLLSSIQTPKGHNGVEPRVAYEQLLIATPCIDCLPFPFSLPFLMFHGSLPNKPVVLNSLFPDQHLEVPNQRFIKHFSMLITVSFIPLENWKYHKLKIITKSSAIWYSICH